MGRPRWHVAPLAWGIALLSGCTADPKGEIVTYPLEFCSGDEASHTATGALSAVALDGDLLLEWVAEDHLEELSSLSVVVGEQTWIGTCPVAVEGADYGSEGCIPEPWSYADPQAASGLQVVGELPGLSSGDYVTFSALWEWPDYDSYSDGPCWDYRMDETGWTAP